VFLHPKSKVQINNLEQSLKRKANLAWNQAKINQRSQQRRRALKLMQQAS